MAGGCKYFFMVAALTAVFHVAAPAPEAEAMEPGLAAVFAPVAIEVIKVVAPYAFLGIKNLMMGIAEMGVELLGFFRMPLGFLEAIFLAPFGFFSDGLIDMWEGGKALGMFVVRAVVLPMRIFGPVL